MGYLFFKKTFVSCLIALISLPASPGRVNFTPVHGLPQGSLKCAKHLKEMNKQVSTDMLGSLFPLGQ